MQIAHIADIHIGHPGRESEYTDVFERMAAAIPPEALVLIAGDIFDHKVRYSGDDVNLFNHLMNLLRNHQVVIIPGNHDSNLNDFAKMDLITPVVRDRPNIHYWKHSGKYEIAGLKFYHVSVFGLETAEEIEQTLQSDEILLYHGMVDGAVFGKHTASGQRITRAIMDKARATLLGDVHQMQYVRPRAAYCGSLIQQNVAESPEKGFLLWNTADFSATFTRIPNSRGFIRLDFRGLTRDQSAEILQQTAAPDQLLKLSVLADDNTDGAILDSVREKFGRLDVVRTTTQPTQIATADSIGETLHGLLVSRGLTQAQAAECVADYMTGTSTIAQRKWRVTGMRWDGLFKYGAANSIDFTALEGGISGVIAPNRAGKSSIIDILIFGLFGELLRADRIGMINDNSEYSYVRVDFISNNTAYYIERKDDRKRHTTLRLFEMVGDQPRNITAETTTKTYTKVVTLIGSCAQLLATGIYYDWTNDITRVSPAERARLLSELFGLSNVDAILRVVKEKIKAQEKILAGLTVPRVKESAVPAAEAALTSLRQEKAALVGELRQVSAEAAELAASISGIRNPTAIRADMFELAPVSVADPAPVVSASAADRKLAASATLSLTDATAALAVLKSQQQPTESPASIQIKLEKLRRTPKPTSPQQPTTPRPNITQLAEASTTASSLLPLATDQQGLQQLRAHVERESARVLQIRQSAQAEIDQLRADIAGLPDGIPVKSADRLGVELANIRLQQLTDTTELQSQIQTLRANTQLQFEDSCRCCKSNKSVLACQLALMEEKLGAINTTNAAIGAANSAKQAQIDAIKLDLERWRRHTLQARLERAQSLLKTEVSTQLTQYLSDFEAREAELAKENARRAAALQSAQASYNTLKRSAEAWDKYDADCAAYTRRLEEFQRSTAEISTLQAALKTAKEQEGLLRQIEAAEFNLRAAEAAIRCEAADSYARYTAYKQYLQDRERLDQLERELETSQAAQSKFGAAAELTAQITRLTEAISAIDVKIGAQAAEVAVARSEAEILDAYNRDYPPIAAELCKLRSYKDCLGTNGLRVQVIRKYIAQVVVSVNEILSKVAGFSISCDVGDNETELYIHEAASRRPLKAGSGFQRFIVAIAMRVALVSVLPASAMFIMIDEGFGCMDKANLMQVVEFMAGGYLAAQSFVFVISHIDEIADAITMPLRIKDAGGCSHVSNCAAAEPAPVVAAQPTGEIQCECGATVKRASLAKHIKSARHCKAVAGK